MLNYSGVINMRFITNENMEKYSFRNMEKFNINEEPLHTYLNVLCLYSDDIEHAVEVLKKDIEWKKYKKSKK